MTRTTPRCTPPGAALSLTLLLLAGCGEPAGWTTFARDDLDADARARLQKAEAARDALAGRLLGELRDALADGGPAKGITVCRERAPAIAQEVAAEQGVRIGRTSFRLRNPANTPPDWAADAVAQRRADPELRLHPERGLAALFPIRLQPQCVTCHGDPAQLAPPIKQALADSYPDDRATGFAAGDLRGWFWVEVP